MSNNIRMARPNEPEAVRTTIVGGRPPAAGAVNTAVPRGIEVLTKKAAVDAAFREALLERRAAAAEEIGLALTAAEKLMLSTVPRQQLEGIINNTRVSPAQVPALLGKVAAVMLAAMGIVQQVGCADAQSAGIRPEDLADQDQHTAQAATKPTTEPLSRGVRPDRPATTQTTVPAPPNVRVLAGVMVDVPPNERMITVFGATREGITTMPTTTQPEPLWPIYGARPGMRGPEAPEVVPKAPVPMDAAPDAAPATQPAASTEPAASNDAAQPPEQLSPPQPAEPRNLAGIRLDRPQEPRLAPTVLGHCCPR